MYAFIVFGAACAVIASLERILGRPIPRLRYSRPILKNRTFVIVPVVMAAVFLWMLSNVLPMRICSHCTPEYAWQSLPAIMIGAIFAFGLSGIAGWIAFAVILIASFSLRLIARVISN
jgi:hypothetical protein